MNRKLPEKSIWEGVDPKGVPEMGFPVGFLIRKGFLKRGSRAFRHHVPVFSRWTAWWPLLRPRLAKS